MSLCFVFDAGAQGQPQSADAATTRPMTGGPSSMNIEDLMTGPAPLMRDMTEPQPLSFPHSDIQYYFPFVRLENLWGKPYRMQRFCLLDLSLSQGVYGHPVIFNQNQAGFIPDFDGYPFAELFPKDWVIFRMGELALFDPRSDAQFVGDSLDDAAMIRERWFKTAVFTLFGRDEWPVGQRLIEYGELPFGSTIFEKVDMSYSMSRRVIDLQLGYRLPLLSFYRHNRVRDEAQIYSMRLGPFAGFQRDKIDDQYQGDWFGAVRGLGVSWFALYEKELRYTDGIEPENIKTGRTGTLRLPLLGPLWGTEYTRDEEGPQKKFAILPMLTNKGWREAVKRGRPNQDQ